MRSVTSYPHIRIAADGTASIGQTRYKVDHLAAEHYHYGWSAEELLRQHPDSRPEEVYATLAYFYDHYDKMVNKIKLGAERVEALRAKQTLSRAELLARKEASKFDGHITPLWKPDRRSIRPPRRNIHNAGQAIPETGTR